MGAGWALLTPQLCSPLAPCWGLGVTLVHSMDPATLSAAHQAQPMEALGGGWEP